MKLNARVLLYISAVGASCAIYRNGSIEDVRAWAPDEEGWESFNEVLLRHPGKPVAIAVDTVDEIYRREALPRAHGGDRREMTGRRARQVIHHSPYRAALRIDSRAPTPDQDRYLIMGLTNPEILRPWLDICHVRGTHLAGIWLLPALSSALASRLRLGRGRLLLVSEQTGGLRLTYLENGTPRFSRLAPVDGSQYDNPLEHYAEEIERTRQALVGQRLLTRAEPVRTILVDPLNTLSELHALLPESAGFQCESIARARLLETLRLPPSLLAETADAIYLRLLSDAPAGANLMTPEQHALTRSYWLRRGLRFTAAAWLGISTLTSAVLALDALRLDRIAEQHRHTAQTLRAQEASLLAPEGGPEALAGRLRAVSDWQRVAALERDPVEAIALARASAIASGLRLDRIDWRTSEPGPRLELEGALPGFEGDYPGAHRRVDAFARALGKALAQPARVTEWPLDPRTDQILEGEFGQSRVSARFRVETGIAP